MSPSENRYSHSHHHHHHHHSSRIKRCFNIILVSLASVFIVFVAFVILAPDTANRILHFEIIQQMMYGSGTNRMITYDGIDISHHQGFIDWPVVSRDSCIQFVYMKATEGATHVDSLYERNLREARLVGMKVGSYHYLTSSSTVEEQFNNFLRHADPDKQDLRPMIDVEEEGVKGLTKVQLQQCVADFAALVKRHYGVWPVIYSYVKFYNQYLAPRFNSFHLFLARYDGMEPVIEGQGQHNIWQHTNQGTIFGIKGKVDLDSFSQGTTLEDLLIDK